LLQEAQLQVARLPTLASVPEEQDTTEVATTPTIQHSTAEAVAAVVLTLLQPGIVRAPVVAWRPRVLRLQGPLSTPTGYTKVLDMAPMMCHHNIALLARVLEATTGSL